MFRTKSSFLTLFVIFGVSLLVTGLALGGATKLTSGDKVRPLTAERAKAGQVWKAAVGSRIDRDMSFIAGTNDFFLDVVIGQGATWVSSTPNVTVTIVSDDATVANKVGSGLSQTRTTTNVANDTIRISWDAGALPVTTFSTARLVFDNLSFTDVNNQVGGVAAIDIGIFTFDAFTTTALDVGSNTVAGFYQGVAFFLAPTVVKTTATVDVNQDRKGFVATAPDTKTKDHGASIALKTVTGGSFDTNGTPFLITTALTRVVAQFSDDAALGGITTFEGAGWATGKNKITLTSTPAFDTVPRAVTITVDGTSTIETRTVTATFTFRITQPDTTSKDFVIGVGIEISKWDLNGCVLIAHWVQGNTDAPGVAGPGVFKSRLYITNHTSSIGAVDVRVQEHDLSTGGVVGMDLGSTSTADLAANGALLIRMEDILDALGVTLPHLVNGGNLTAVVTVRVSECSGSYQTFDESTNTSFFGTANMTKVQ